MRMTWTQARTGALLAAIAVAASLLWTSDAHAGSNPTVRITPSFQNVAAGGLVDVDLNVEGAPTFAAYEFHMSFDPSVLQFVSITRGGEILQNAGRDPLCLGPDAADLDNAIVSYGCASTGGSGGPSGSGTLATITFRALCAARTDLAFVPAGKDLSVDPVSLATVLGDSFPATGLGGQINVNGTACTGSTLRGDANCNGSVNAVDAAIVLQLNAGLVSPNSCASNSDANQDGRTDAIDAALILQFVAGLINSL